jgi:hypothetical protein
MDAGRRAPLHVAMRIAMHTPDAAGTSTGTRVSLSTRATTSATLVSRTPA